MAPVAAKATGKQTRMKKYIYFAGQFDGHGNLPVRYCMHGLIEEVQGFTRSHWMLPPGKYLLG
jgi:hypothetical protein